MSCKKVTTDETASLLARENKKDADSGKRERETAVDAAASDSDNAPFNGLSPY